MSVKVDINNDGKPDFSINITQIIAVLSIFASIVGSYYTLLGKMDALEVKIQRAEQMPPQEVKQKDLENMTAIIEQKIDKVAIQASENMDGLKELARELRNNYKRNR